MITSYVPYGPAMGPATAQSARLATDASGESVYLVIPDGKILREEAMKTCGRVVTVVGTKGFSTTILPCFREQRSYRLAGHITVIPNDLPSDVPNCFWRMPVGASLMEASVDGVVQSYWPQVGGEAGRVTPIQIDRPGLLGEKPYGVLLLQGTEDCLVHRQ